MRFRGIFSKCLQRGINSIYRCRAFSPPPFSPREYRFVVECGIISVLFLFTFGNKNLVEKSDFLRWNLDDRRGSLLPGIDKLPLFDGG